MNNKIIFIIPIILIICFILYNTPFELESFSNKCIGDQKEKNKCLQCNYPEIKEKHCKKHSCHVKKECKEKKCIQECPDMSRYILKSKVPHCPKYPDLNAYILKSEVPACPPEPDLSKFVLKTTIPPCRCPPCPKNKCPEIPKNFMNECLNLKKENDHIRNRLAREKRNNDFKYGNKVYSGSELNNILAFYEDYKNGVKKYNNITKKNCKLVTDTFGSINGSITNPYNYISNPSITKDTENLKFQETITKKHKNILF